MDEKVRSWGSLRGPKVLGGGPCSDLSPGVMPLSTDIVVLRGQFASFVTDRMVAREEKA